MSVYARGTRVISVGQVVAAQQFMTPEITLFNIDVKKCGFVELKDCTNIKLYHGLHLL